MVLKRGVDINRVLQPKKYSRLVNASIVIGIVIGLIIIYYSFFLFLFNIGDYVSSKNTPQIGKIVGLSPFKMGYLVLWSEGEYSTEPFWNLKSLSTIEDLGQIDKINKLKSENSSSFAEFKKEDNFNNYIISEGEPNSGQDSDLSSDSEPTVLMYLGLFGNWSYQTEKNCTSDFVCSDWGGCYADYTLNSLLSGEPINGVSYRYCKDNNKCLPDLVDSMKCTNQVEITTRVKNWCGKDYLEILDSYGRVLARLDNNNFKNYMDVSLNMGNIGYCYYCHDGKKDFDETSKDCGGSCISCAELKKLTSAA